MSQECWQFLADHERSYPIILAIGLLITWLNQPPDCFNRIVRVYACLFNIIPFRFRHIFLLDFFKEGDVFIQEIIWLSADGMQLLQYSGINCYSIHNTSPSILMFLRFYWKTDIKWIHDMIIESSIRFSKIHPLRFFFHLYKDFVT